MEKSAGNQVLINNDFYESLHDDWHTADNHPIALLRAENRLRAPWIAREIANRLGQGVKVLDIGCGGGLLSNYLAGEGHNLTGVDISQSSLDTAKRHDITNTARYLFANAYELPFENESFDAVCAMDILEHVEQPDKLLLEAARVLRPGGICFFHTFNRNFLSYLLIIKGVDFFVENAPKNMHVYRLFIKPAETSALCHKAGMAVDTMIGLAPIIWQRPFWQLALTGRVPGNFQFQFTKSLTTGYCGIAVKLPC